MGASNIFPVMFNAKERKFLGRGGKWQSPEEFIRNPPAEGRDVAVEPTKPAGSTKQPGGYFDCIDNTLYWFQENPAGGYDRYDCGSCL